MGIFYVLLKQLAYKFLLTLPSQHLPRKYFKNCLLLNTCRPGVPQKVVSRVFKPDSGLSVGAQVGITIGTLSVVGILFVVIFLCCGADGAACFCEVLRCLLCCCGD